MDYLLKRSAISQPPKGSSMPRYNMRILYASLIEFPVFVFIFGQYYALFFQIASVFAKRLTILLLKLPGKPFGVAW